MGNLQICPTSSISEDVKDAENYYSYYNNNTYNSSYEDYVAAQQQQQQQHQQHELQQQYCYDSSQAYCYASCESYHFQWTYLINSVAMHYNLKLKPKCITDQKKRLENEKYELVYWCW